MRLLCLRCLWFKSASAWWTCLMRVADQYHQEIPTWPLRRSTAGSWMGPQRIQAESLPSYSGVWLSRRVVCYLAMYWYIIRVLCALALARMSQCTLVLWSIWLARFCSSFLWLWWDGEAASRPGRSRWAMWGSRTTGLTWFSTPPLWPRQRLSLVYQRTSSSGRSSRHPTNQKIVFLNVVLIFTYMDQR